MKGLKQLREERAKLARLARELVDKAKEEERSLTSEESAKFDEFMDKITDLASAISREERLADVEQDLDDPAHPQRRAGREDRGPSNDPKENAELQRQAFLRFVRFGPQALSPDQQSLLTQRSIDPEMAALLPEADQRALGTAVAAGGYTIPAVTRASISTGMKAFGGIRRSRAEQITTAGGFTINQPTNDDTGNEGALLGEGSAAGEQDTTFGNVALEAFTYTSKMIRVQRQLLQDSGVDIEAYLRRIIAERLGRITEKHFATGDGSSKPRGVTVAAYDSGVSPDISDGLKANNLIDIKHSLDPAYRELGAEWMFHDTFLKEIVKLSFSATNVSFPIWQPSLRDGEPERILDHPYIVNNNFPQHGTATNRVVCFGDFFAYKVREVSDMLLLRLVERHAEYNQVTFIAFLRCDGDLVDPGTHPIKYAAEVA